MVSPAAIAIGFGAYAVFDKTDAFLTTETGVPVAPVPPEGVDGEYELQPTVTAISPAIMPSRNVIFISIRLRHIAKALPRQHPVHVVIFEQKRAPQWFLCLRKLKCFQVT
jgi:hypothetical protein